MVDQFTTTVAAPEAYKTHIHELAASLLPPRSAAIVARCDEHAEDLHRGQLRGDGSPYIVHPRRVALLGATICSDEAVLAAFLVGLLHDVVEDCGVDISWVEEQYGPVVARS